MNSDTQLSQKEDFLTNLSSLADISSTAKFRNEEYVLLINIGESNDTAIITITEGLNHLWVKELGFVDFQEIRKSIGIEGNYATYFQFLKDALLQTGGNYKVDVKNGNELSISVVYKISKSATLIGSIDMGPSFQFAEDQTMFRRFIKKMMFDLQETKQRESTKKDKEINSLTERLAIAENRVKELSAQLPSNENSMNSFSAEPTTTTNTLKRKARTDLVNPNIKQRKPAGAKLGATLKIPGSQD